jgi:8-hydroxy-5-deazaflavin:NADPH oxidoreductase
MATIGLIGAGKIGSQVARLAAKSGYDVVVSNSRGPATLTGLLEELGPRARAGTALEAAKAGDIVIDTNNYYPNRDGHIPELDSESTTTSELLQAHLPKSKVVKAFNHIYAAELTTDGRPAGTASRRALVIAGDDAEAKKTVSSSRYAMRSASSSPSTGGSRSSHWTCSGAPWSGSRN